MDTIYRMERLPDGPGKFLPLAASEVAEGMAASAATAVARLGGAVALWAAVGDDPVGERLVAAMESEGVDCAVIQRVTGAPSAVAAVLVDLAGERMIIPFYAPDLLAAPRQPEAISRGVFAAVMVDVRWPQAAEPAMTAARHAGAHVVLDADVAATDVLDRLAPLATHLVASAPGAALLAGAGAPSEAVRRLAARFDGEAVVTAGADGAYWFDRTCGAVRHIAAPVVEAVDTTAAGDVFHGAFTLALVEGRGMAASLRFATAAAALKCTRHKGRFGAPDRADTEAFAATMSG